MSDLRRYPSNSDIIQILLAGLEISLESQAINASIGSQSDHPVFVVIYPLSFSAHASAASITPDQR